MTKIVNGTATNSKYSSLNSYRTEFEEGFEHFELSLHCDELNVEQETITRDSYKVKTFTAHGRNGNVARLKIFFEL